MSLSTDLTPFFEPAAVAIVGATRTPGFGYGLPKSMEKNGWGPRTYLVNPRGGELHGFKVYKSVSELPDQVDLAVVIVGARAVPGVIDEIGARGIRAAIVESAGFAETGDGGRALQEAAVKAAARHGVRMIGPNCVGVVNPRNRFATAEILDEAMTPGPLAIIAQSGVFGNVLLDCLHEKDLFISKAVTLGNKMDLNECDLLDYMGDDDDTKTVMMYIEGAADGARLKDTLAEVSAKKPVLVLKSGRTGPGRAATASHTGSLSGRDRLYDALFAQTGAIRAESLDDLIAFARVFTTQPLPEGGRLGVVTSSGSLGALAVDAAVERGLELPGPSPGLVESIEKAAPGWMNVRNPLDVGPSGLFAKGLSALMAEPDIDMVLAIAIIPYAVVKNHMPLEVIGKAWLGDVDKLRAMAPGKPLVVCCVGASEFIDRVTDLAGPMTPVLESPEQAARALAALHNYARWRRGRGRLD